MPHHFGTRSRDLLLKAHPDLRKILIASVQCSAVDFGIAETARNITRARFLFETGKSTLNPDKGQFSSHIPVDEFGNYDADGFAMAADTYIWHLDPEMRRKLQYDIPSLCYVAGVIDCMAKAMLEAGEIEHGIRWGGNWDGDGIIALDQKFDDYVHFELELP